MVDYPQATEPSLVRQEKSEELSKLQPKKKRLASGASETVSQYTRFDRRTITTPKGGWS